MALKHFYNADKVVILSPTNDICKTCDILNIPYINIEYLPLRQIIIRPFKVWKQLKYIRSIIKYSEIHFSHTQYDVFCFILVNFLRSSTNIFFHNFEYVIEHKLLGVRKYLYPKYFLYKLIIKNLYNTNLVMKKFAGRPLLAIDERYLSNGIKIIDNKDAYYEEIYPAIFKYQINIKPVESLFLSQNLKSISSIDIKSIDNLYKFLKGFNITYKLHPYMDEKDEFEDCEKIESYLPAELIFKSVKKCVISVNSVGLIEASKFSHLKAISLIDLVKINDNSIVYSFKDLLINYSNHKILFPSTYKELEHILINSDEISNYKNLKKNKV